MTLKTLGMGIAKLATKKAKAVKKEFVRPKTNIPLYVTGATAFGLAHLRHKAKEKSKKKKAAAKKEANRCPVTGPFWGSAVPIVA